MTLRDFGQITSDLERFNAGAFLNFEVAPTLDFFSESIYYKGKARDLINQPIFNALTFGYVSAPLQFTVDNPFLTDQTRSVH